MVRDKCCNGNLGHRQPSIGCLGLRFAVEEGPTDSLQLMVRDKCAALEVDCLPSEAENLALAKTKNQHQHVCGVERIGVRACEFEKSPSLLARSGPARGFLRELHPPAVDFLASSSVDVFALTPT